MKNVLMIVLCFHALSLVAQNKILISGKVLEKGTSTPLQFAHVGVKHQNFGIVSNEAGEFDLYIPDSNRRDTLFISMVGYKRFEDVVGNVADRGTKIFYLEPDAIQLQAVEITALSVEAIQNKVNANYQKNYPADPYQLEGFYREVIKENNEYSLLIEAAVAIQDKGYRPVKNRNSIAENVSIRELRRSFIFIEKAQRRYRANLLAQVLGSNDIRYGFGKNGLFEGLKVSRGEDEILDGTIIYTLDISTPVGRGKMYVDSETFAVIRAETVIDSRRKLYENDSIQSFQTGIATTYEYKKYQDKYYLSYGVKSTDYEIFDKFSKKVTFQHNFKSVLTINNINTGNIAPFPKDQLMDSSLPLIYVKKKYNPAFWKEYNLLKQSPVEEKVIADLEKKMPLSNQFSQQ